MNNNLKWYDDLRTWRENNKLNDINWARYVSARNKRETILSVLHALLGFYIGLMA